MRGEGKKSFLSFYLYLKLFPSFLYESKSCFHHAPIHPFDNTTPGQHREKPSLVVSSSHAPSPLRSTQCHPEGRKWNIFHDRGVLFQFSSPNFSSLLFFFFFFYSPNLFFFCHFILNSISIPRVFKLINKLLSNVFWRNLGSFIMTEPFLC